MAPPGPDDTAVPPVADTGAESARNASAVAEATGPATVTPSSVTAPRLLPLEQRRWALAFALLDIGPADDLPGDRAQSESRLRGMSITSREDVLAYFKAKRDGDAYEISRLIAVAAWAASVGFIDAATAWNVIWAAASLARRTYKSWREFGETYDMIFSQITDGRASAEQEVARLLSNADSPWVTLPWDVMGESAKARVLRASCRECGAPRTRPSATAYVYCDHCGALVDYDVSVALAQGASQPGPVYETLRAQLAGSLEEARNNNDKDAYRALQRLLFDAWVTACPQSTPIRTRDPDYRERYVAWLAEADTIAAFDRRSRELEKLMRSATGELAFVYVDGKPRVTPEPFRDLVDLVFALEAQRDAVFQQTTLYAMHPDGAPRELQRRIGHSMFVQGWLPYLGEDDAKALLDRTSLVREYDELPPPETRALPCHRCGGPLDIVAGAKRVVCDHCGRLVDIIG